MTFDLPASDPSCASETLHIAPRSKPSRLIGESEDLRRIRQYTRRVTDSDITTIISGPTGSGKEVVALEMHEQSRRSAGPLVAINCAAIPDELLEGELFGYEKGAYTGATSSHPGKLKLADKGTLFLDEIGELSLAGQAKLLRALETGEAYRLGSRVPTKFDIRIIAATNRDLYAEMAAGRFRSDLYYRIAVAKIELSPIAERRADILPIAQHFCQRIGGTKQHRLRFSDNARNAMLGYAWPGNARELRNCVELLVLTCSGREIRLTDLPDYVRQSAWPVRAERHCAETGSGDEQSRLMEALHLCGGNKSRAAEMLNCSRMTLYRKLARLGAGTPAHPLA